VIFQEPQIITYAALAMCFALCIGVFLKLRSVSRLLTQQLDTGPAPKAKTEPQAPRIFAPPPPTSEEEDVILSKFLLEVDSGTDIATAATLFNMTEDEARVVDMCYREFASDSANNTAIS
jgi:hypothetical protein